MAKVKKAKGPGSRMGADHKERGLSVGGAADLHCAHACNMAVVWR